MTTYGQSIRWTNRDGSVTRVNITGRDTPEEAREVAIRDAEAFGWTPPKWWQWWRRDDTRLP